MRRRKPDQWEYRYRVAEAHGRPPAHLRPGFQVVKDEDQGNRVTEFKVYGGTVLWVVVLEFDGAVRKAG